MATEPTEPDVENLDPDTIEADERDARAEHHPDRPPTPEEEEAAERAGMSDRTAEAYKEAAERGANVKGEGQI